MLSRRQALKGIGVSAITATTVPGIVSAGRCNLNWGRRLSSHRPGGDLVVNVTQDVINDADSGFHGFWAHDDYRRHIQMWDVGDVFVAIVEYHGEAEAVAGRNSPGDGHELDGDEVAQMHGGYAATITGDWLDDLDWPTHGYVGEDDYGSDLENGEIRPDAFPWHQQYLENDSFSFDWWGWVYRGGRYGTWVNSQDKNCGDIS